MTRHEDIMPICFFLFLSSQLHDEERGWKEPPFKTAEVDRQPSLQCAEGTSRRIGGTAPILPSTDRPWALRRPGTVIPKPRPPPSSPAVVTVHRQRSLPFFSTPYFLLLRSGLADSVGQYPPLPIVGGSFDVNTVIFQLFNLLFYIFFLPFS